MKQRLIPWLLALFVLACMVFIYLFSAETASESTVTSRSVIEQILSLLDANFDSLPSEVRQQRIASLQFIVRKGAHFSVYALLGFLAALLVMSITPTKTAHLLGWGIAALYAVSDEIHQAHVPGRSAELRDVLIDACGALLGAWFANILYKLYQKVKNKKKSGKK